MANTIRLKRASGSDPGASDLVTGELAVRTDTGKLFTKKDDNSVTEIGVTPIADGSITSAKIADGAIVNADVNASAAIAGTKISPDFGSQNITTTGTITTTDDIIINGSTNDESVLRFRDAGAESWMLRQTNSDNILAFRRNSNNYLTLQANGNVDVANGLDVTGDISVSGTVDGRDVATDGSKLDGIESNATADQSASEIVALIADQTIAPSAIDMEDSEEIRLGNDDDLKIYHSGSHSYIQDAGTGSLILVGNSVTMQNAAQNENMFTATQDGAVALYFDNNKKFQTTSAGCGVTGDLTFADNGKAKFGASDDLQIFHDGSNSYIKDAGTGSLLIRGSTVSIQSVSGEAMIEGVADGAVTIKHDNSTKLETTSSGVTITGDITGTAHINLGNDKRLRVGSTNQMQFFHDGNAAILGGSGDLYQKSAGSMYLRTAGDENAISMIANGSVDLYHDNNKKFETTGVGVKITGNARTDIVTVSDASNITIPMNTGTHFVVTLGGNRTFINSNMQTSDAHGASGSIFIVQDGTGSRTVSFQSNYKFAGGTAPTLSTAANAVDRLDYVVRATNNVHCVVTLDVK